MHRVYIRSDNHPSAANVVKQPFAGRSDRTDSRNQGVRGQVSIAGQTGELTPVYPDEHRLPLAVKVPNAATKRAMTELEAGKGEKFASVDALMADLNAGND